MNAYPVEYVFGSLPQGTYADETTCQRDVMDCINAHPTLYPEAAQVKMEHNNAQRLVVVKGTIPVVYNHTQYHFPVEIVLPVYYPHESPLFKVTPTSELKILPGHRHVDSEGRVYHPYISNWGLGQQQRPNLQEMVRQVALEFSKAPPLYSPPKYSPQPPPVYSNAVPPPPVYRSVPAPPQVPPPPVYRAPPVPPSTNASTSQLAAAGHSKLFRARCVDKIRFRLETALPKMQKDFQSELEVSEKLQSNCNVIDSQLNEAQQCEREMESQLLQLHQGQIGLQEQIQRQQRQKEEHSVEESIGFPFDNVAFHLFQSVVDSLALEDVLYQLNNKLQKREIDLKTFLKLSRALSREHFFKTALALKLNQQQQQLQPPRRG